MGKIKRHGISSSIFMYVGLVLGFVNSTLLFPVTLGKEIYGFCQFLVSMGATISVFSLFGLPQVTVRFFSRFRDAGRQHDGYFAFLFLAGSASTLVVSLILILFKPWFVRWFGDGRSGAFIDQYYWGLVVMFVFTALNTILTSYARALQRTRVPTFFSQVFGRIVTLALILAVVLQWIDKQTFIALFSLKLAANFGGLFLFVFLIGELHTRVNWRIFKRPVFKEMVKFGGYAILADLGTSLINRIDMIMIAALLAWGEVGIYSVFFFLSTVIVLPHRGVGTIAFPLIAEYWQKQEREKIAALYSRMALNNWIPALLVFIGILANLDNAILLLGEDFRPGQMVAVYLGIAQLLHVLNGYNGMILINSPLYRYDLLFKLISATITVTSNYFFIHWMGLTGAALATGMTILLSNALNQYFVYRNFRMHPFSWPMLYAALIAGIVYGLNLLIPPYPGHFAGDIILRSAGMTLLYAGLILYFNIAPDITSFVWEQWKKVRRLIGI